MRTGIVAMICTLWLCVTATGYRVWAQTNIYSVKKGNVQFSSVATQELIHASSNQLLGVVDVAKKTFAYKIPIISFNGFNNALQREHFNENYMETTQYAEATYTGKIIEDVDLSKPGEYDIRAKGKLTIHGVEQERIIKVHVVSGKNGFTIHADFIVSLSDHNIKIPRIVNEKLSNDVHVSVNATFAPNR